MNNDQEMDELLQEIDAELEQMDVEDGMAQPSEKHEESWLGSIISTVIGSVVGAAL